MFGFFFGTLCLLGLVAVTRGPRHHGCGHHKDGRRNHHRGRRRSGERFGRAASEVFKRKLGIDEDQEDLIDHALDDLHGSVRGLRTSMKASKSDFVAAFSGEEVDDAALAALFEAQDQDLKWFRREAVSALKQVHAVLDPEQRQQATSWLGRAGGWV